MNGRLLTGTRALIGLGALLIFAALNHAIVGKENIRRSGAAVYLRLAPVDPRSLLQGDYMALRFELVRQLEQGHGRDTAEGVARWREGEQGLAAVALNAERVGTLADATAPTALRIRYRIRNGQVWLGTNAFFFAEGEAQRFSGARYGEFRVDRQSGEAVLVGLRDAALKPL